MFKLDQVRKCLLNCDLCHKLLIEPVIIHPCNNTVCKSHIHKELTFSENQLKCVFCPEKVKHIVPEKGYVVNKRIQKDLNMEINKLKMTPEYSDVCTPNTLESFLICLFPCSSPFVVVC